MHILTRSAALAAAVGFAAIGMLGVAHADSMTSGDGIKAQRNTVKITNNTDYTLKLSKAYILDGASWGRQPDAEIPPKGMTYAVSYAGMFNTTDVNYDIDGTDMRLYTHVVNFSPIGAAVDGSINLWRTGTGIRSGVRAECQKSGGGVDGVVNFDCTLNKTP